MLNCHPSTAWEAMKRGWTLAEIAAKHGDDLGQLDRELWSWLGRKWEIKAAERARLAASA